MSTNPKEPRTNAEFVAELLRLSIDFNSQIMTIATSELAGEPSGKNRTHQRQVIGNLQTLGEQYSRKLDFHFDERERELRGEQPAEGYSKEDTKAMRRTIAILDAVMNTTPNKETADASNLLELMLSQGSKPTEATDLPKPKANPTPNDAKKGKKDA